jgi:DNA-directed RNA polymerase specialized sigma24 family protein
MADDDPVTSGEAAAVQSPDAYLYRTVVNGCRAWIRRKQTGARLARPEATPPARAPELDETRAALDRLSPSQRTAVVLRFYGDLPWPRSPS